ncbi:F0F1 ATP synthase subunit delta [Acidihalobacter ferrooxydans]|uniref:ATP synthase subunit delta n=1 Tax=Acidihalobacter ferrooxydans TaxID=1765967 RepID=A0A1P8UKZ5_9GAMM|nr:F0F1 ATP synthase subunit delta [Acidihalobacter ferrooxydans]APZ44424.1 F0F1 ATP synthase subunit delta [Acidihalobacter ferrooxydans]
MSEYITFARPYARAIYDLALAEGSVEQWGGMLNVIAEVAAQEQVATLVGDPRVSDDLLAQVIIDVCADALNSEGRNLVRLLVENRRLSCATDLAALFEHLRAQGEGVIEAEVISAKPLSDRQQGELAGALKKRLGREVTLHTTLDETLLAGVLVRAGDLVIDGSYKGRLGQLSRAMSC